MAAEGKEFRDKENTLHVAIALESVSMDGIFKQEDIENDVARQCSTLSDISIANIFKKINPSDGNFLKYVPDGFLDDAQLRAKRKAIEANAAESENRNPSSQSLKQESKETIHHALPTNPDGNPDASTHLTQDHIETVRIATKQALENMGMQDTELGNNADSDQVLANALKKFKEQQYGSRGERKFS